MATARPIEEATGVAKQPVKPTLRFVEVLG
jgi:hypothetical protein